LDPNRLMNPQLSFDFAHNRKRALKAILKAVEVEQGNLSATARQLSVSIDTLRRWVDKEPEIRRALDKARIQAIKDGG